MLLKVVIFDWSVPRFERHESESYVKDSHEIMQKQIENQEKN